MTRLLHRHRADEALIPCATSHRAPSWPGRTDADAEISFADITRLPEPEWAGRSQQAGFRPGRYTVSALVPAGQLAAVPLPTERVLDDIETVVADVLAAVPAALADGTRLTADLIGLALAEVAALLDEPHVENSHDARGAVFADLMFDEAVDPR